MMHSRRLTAGSVLKALVVAVVTASMLYPFLYMLAVTFSDNLAVMRNEVTIYPMGFSLRAYELVFGNPRIFIGYRNTVLYVSLGTLISLAATSLAAYALSRKEKLIFHRFFSVLFLVPFFFSGGMIPKYLAVRDYGLLDRVWAVVLPSAVSMYNLILMRSFYAGSAREIAESGEIDGLNDLGVFWYLVLPTSKAVLATIGLFYAVGLWNAFMEPFLYLSSPERVPLQVVLREVVLQGSTEGEEALGRTADTMVTEEALKFATILVSIAPVIAIYPFIQRYFVQGVMLGSLKG